MQSTQLLNEEHCLCSMESGLWRPQCLPCPSDTGTHSTNHHYPSEQSVNLSLDFLALNCWSPLYSFSQRLRDLSRQICLGGGSLLLTVPSWLQCSLYPSSLCNLWHPFRQLIPKMVHFHRAFGYVSLEMSSKWKCAKTTEKERNSRILRSEFTLGCIYLLFVVNVLKSFKR